MNTKGKTTIAALMCALAAASPAGASTRFALEHRDSGFSLNTALPLDSKEVVFSNEPDFVGQNVVRSAIATGPGAEDFIGFAWDRTARKLYLDLNGDLDLTNDEGGTFNASNDRSYMHDFGGIRLLLDRNGVSVPYMVRVYFYTYSGSQRYGYLNILSGWSGEMELGGKPWTLSVVDNLDGMVDRNDQFLFIPVSTNTTDALVHSRTLPGATGLHVDGHAYDLDFAFEGETGASVLGLDVADSGVALGTLNIEGASIARLALYPESADGYLVVADRPEAALTVPVGSYSGGQTYLNGGANLVFEARPPAMTVAQDQPASIKTGGPLDNTVVAEYRGAVIELGYELRGVGGEEYQGLNDDRRKPPRFAVYKGPLKLYSGKFEYG